ncbi:MAG: hypothetical protein ACM3UL_03615 [Ignavibacteria bacterium]
MNFEGKKIAGLLLFVGAAQFVLAAIIAEAIDTKYTFLQPMNWLGGGSAGYIYNSSIFLLGLLIIISAYLLYNSFKGVKNTFSNRLFWFLLTLTGIGAISLGIFNETFGDAHVFAVRMFWVFSVVTAIISYRFHKKPLSYVSVILGLVSLVAIILFLSEVYIPSPFDFYLGLGRGGMQRMIQYPTLLWLLGFGAHLTGDSKSYTNTNPKTPINDSH